MMISPTYFFIDLMKAHIKAHFRRNPDTGKLEFIHDYDDKRHATEVHVAYERGDRVKITNPKSRHNGKEGTIHDYDSKADEFRVKWDDPGEGQAKTVFRPHHVEHQDENKRPGAKKKEANPFAEKQAETKPRETKDEIKDLAVQSIEEETPLVEKTKDGYSFEEKTYKTKPEAENARTQHIEDTYEKNKKWLTKMIEKTAGAKSNITRTRKVYTPSQKEIEVKFEVKPASELITSNDAQGNLNPDYPKELQPRERDRDASKLQIAHMSQNIVPELLGESAKVSDGAPIIGNDNVVESGNGRSIAITEAYKHGNADHYKEWLVDNAKRFGLNPEEIKKVDNPVLVRVRQTDLDRAKFAIEANQSDLASMSPAETAKADAKRLTDDDMEKLVISDTGSILNSSNRDFIHRFLINIGENETGQYITKGGDYTKQLGDRIQAAIFAKAYDDEKLIGMMAEESDQDIKGVIGALNQAAPDFAKARMLTGSLGDYNVIPHLVGAVDLIRKSKSQGVSIEQYLSQTNMFHKPEPETVKIAQEIGENLRRPKRIGDMLQKVAQLIRSQIEKSQNMGMFPGKKVTTEDIINVVKKQMEKIHG